MRGVKKEMNRSCHARATLNTYLQIKGKYILQHATRNLKASLIV